MTTEIANESTSETNTQQLAQATRPTQPNRRTRRNTMSTPAQPRDITAEELRADPVRRVVVDSAFNGIQISNPLFAVSPESTQLVIANALRNLETMIDNGYLNDIPVSLTRGLGLPASVAPRLTRNMVNTVLESPAPAPNQAQPDLNFCGLSDASRCVPMRFVLPEIAAMRGFPNQPVTPTMNPTRTLPLNDPMALYIGAAYAQQNPAEASSRVPLLSPEVAQAVASQCFLNSNAPNTPTIKDCVSAGASIVLARRSARAF